MMNSLHFTLFAFSLCIVYTFAENSDHDDFLKQAHFHELGVQIQHMHEKLYQQCPHIFDGPDSASATIIGRRRSADLSLDLKIELAEKTLADLIQQYGNCTSNSQATIPHTTVTVETRRPKTTVETATTTTAGQTTITNMLYTTTSRRKLFSLKKRIIIYAKL